MGKFHTDPSRSETTRCSVGGLRLGAEQSYLDEIRGSTAAGGHQSVEPGRSLAEAGVGFVATDMPHANRLTVGVMALVTEEEGPANGARVRSDRLQIFWENLNNGRHAGAG